MKRTNYATFKGGQRITSYSTRSHVPLNPVFCTFPAQASRSWSKGTGKKQGGWAKGSNVFESNVSREDNWAEPRPSSFWPEVIQLAFMLRLAAAVDWSRVNTHLPVLMQVRFVLTTQV
jgi:hypothetical protein